MTKDLTELLEQIRDCRICEKQLPLGPRPVIRAAKQAKIAIIGQAPGTKVHKTGIPWDDPSGKKLREWLNISDDDFYNEKIISIIPMGFCYPGKGKSGDLPPRPECAPEWHSKLLKYLPNLEIVILAGSYAVNYYLPKYRSQTLTEKIKKHDSIVDTKYIPLVHPSPRNRIWLSKNQWFETSYIPKIRQRIQKHLVTSN